MEKAYFGMNTLRVTYGPHGNKSHKNSWAIDLGGADTGIDPFYAPYTGIVRRLRSNSNGLSLLNLSSGLMVPRTM